MAEDRYRETSEFRLDFPDVSMGQGFRFNVYDSDYESSCRLSEVDYGYDVPEALQPPETDPEIYQALLDGTADETQFLSGWAVSADISGNYDITSEEESLEETAAEISDECEDLDIDQSLEATLGEPVTQWRRPVYEVEIEQGMRTYPECLDDYISKPGDDCKCPYHPMEEFNNIHRLSQISRQVTSELGECLWENSIVNFPEAELFFVFFKDRPRIWSSVQGISLTVYCHESSMGTTPTSLLLKIAEFVSHNLDLRLLTICLETKWGALVDLPEFEKMREWTAIFRSMKVKEAFSVNLHERYRYALDSDDTEDELRKSICDLWRPDTLRKSKSPEQMTTPPSPSPRSL